LFALFTLSMSLHLSKVTKTIFLLALILRAIDSTEARLLRNTSFTARAATTSTTTTTRRVQEANNAQEWLLDASNLTTGTTLLGERDFRVATSGDGNTVAIGSPMYNIGRGMVRVHRFDESSRTWYQLGVDILGEIERSSDGRLLAIQNAGFALDLSENGNVLAVGYPGGSVCKFLFCHSFVRVFKLTETNEWDPLGSSGVLFDDTESRQAGWAVALAANGLTVAIGGPSLFRSGDPGLVRVYSYDAGASDWNLLGQDVVGEVEDAAAGFAVDLSADGRTLAVGAPYARDLAGYARILYLSEEDQWESVGLQIAGEEDDEVGYQVAMSADASILAVSSGGFRPLVDIRNGRVQVYEAPLPNEMVWTQIGSDILPLDDPEDSFGGSFGDGRSLAISADGRTLALAAPGHSFTCMIPGLAKVFRFEDDWTQIGSSIDSENRRYDEFTWGTDFVALSGDATRLIVGGPLQDPNWRESGYNACDSGRVKYVGNVRVFNLAELGNPTTQPSISPTPAPTLSPTSNPTLTPTLIPTRLPSTIPTLPPSAAPSRLTRTSQNEQPSQDTSAAKYPTMLPLGTFGMAAFVILLTCFITV
jgi:hypothetical protein